jgi:hypothetical protein
MKRIVELSSADASLWVGYLYAARGADEIGDGPCGHPRDLHTHTQCQVLRFSVFY